MILRRSWGSFYGALSRDVLGVWPVPIGAGQSNAEIYEAMWVLETKAR